MPTPHASRGVHAGRCGRRRRHADDDGTDRGRRKLAQELRATGDSTVVVVRAPVSATLQGSISDGTLAGLAEASAQARLVVVITPEKGGTGDAAALISAFAHDRIALGGVHLRSGHERGS
jgi:hypothetical protein